MNASQAAKLLSVFVCFILFVTCVTAAPSTSPDNDSSIRDIIDMLLRERENSLEESRLGYHTVARKAGRSPQLRLRFGKRGDYQYSMPAYLSPFELTSAEK